MTMEQEEKISARALFHNKSHNWNCAQAIVKNHQEWAHMSDEEIELSYRPKGGGRAEGGLCGALYAAKELLGAASPEAAALEEDFRVQLGAKTCAELKGGLKVPCTATVELADQLLSKYHQQQVERTHKVD